MRNLYPILEGCGTAEDYFNEDVREVLTEQFRSILHTSAHEAERLIQDIRLVNWENDD